MISSLSPPPPLQGSLPKPSCDPLACAFSCAPASAAAAHPSRSVHSSCPCGVIHPGRPASPPHFACFPWPDMEVARLPAVASVSGCSSPSTRFCTASTSRCVASDSACLPWSHREVATLPSVASVSVLLCDNSALLRTRDHHASARPRRISPVNPCWHTWHSHHNAKPL
jgi:hypothetical protein